MYADDNAGELFKNNFTSHDLWFGPLAAYIDKDEVRYCPATAKNPNEPPLRQWVPDQLFGDSKTGWVWNFSEELEYGSYAYNGWLYSDNFSSYTEDFNNISEIQHPAITPLFSDSIWIDSWPKETDTCSADFDLNLGSQAMMGRILLNRHFDKTNIAFVDGHVESVELRHLWSLTWHKEWTPIENMTREDGSPIYR